MHGNVCTCVGRNVYCVHLSRTGGCCSRCSETWQSSWRTSEQTKNCCCTKRIKELGSHKTCVLVRLCVAVRCSVLQCAAVCRSVLQCAAVCSSVLQCVAVCRSVLQCVAVYCSVLQCAAVCCSVPQCVLVRLVVSHLSQVSILGGYGQ